MKTIQYLVRDGRDRFRRTPRRFKARAVIFSGLARVLSENATMSHWRLMNWSKEQLPFARYTSTSLVA